MVTYLKKVMKLIPCLNKFKLTQVPRAENLHADTLSKLASSKDLELLKFAPVEYLYRLSTTRTGEVMWIGKTPPMDAAHHSISPRPHLARK